jgi:hypothetical protein
VSKRKEEIKEGRRGEEGKEIGKIKRRERGRI